MKKESIATKKKKEEKMIKSKTKTERTEKEFPEVNSPTLAKAVKDGEPNYPEELAILMNQVYGDLEKIRWLIEKLLSWGEETSFDFRSWMLERKVAVSDFQSIVYWLTPISRKLFEKCVPKKVVKEHVLQK